MGETENDKAPALADSLRRDTKKTLYVAVACACLLPFLYWLWFYVINDLPAALDPGAWGEFGDFIGGVLNPFVAFCALYWLTRSIRIQKEELAATKNELANSRLAQENQAKTLEKQRFEDTFFALLEQHNSLLQKLVVEVDLAAGMFSPSKAAALNDEIQRHGYSLAEAKAALESDERFFGHYFRVLYQILKFVSIRCPGSEVSERFTVEEITEVPVTIDEKLYTNIVRSFINIDLAQLLAINCYCDSDDGYWKYKCLVERYEFLEHMPFERNQQKYIAVCDAFEFYAQRAFGKSDYALTMI